MKNTELVGLLFKNKPDEYELWTEFSISKEEEKILEDFMENHRTEGGGFVGKTPKDILEQMCERYTSEDEIGRRKVLFSNGMCEDFMIILTDAPKKAIEEWCHHYTQEFENGENTYFDTLKKYYDVIVLADSELNNFKREDIKLIGYDEAYDLFDYCPEEK